MERLKRAIGRVLNALGVPGFVRVDACRDRLGFQVQVMVDDAFTTISVSNLRLLFRRFSGKFDGIVVDPVDCGGTRAELFQAPKVR